MWRYHIYTCRSYVYCHIIEYGYSIEQPEPSAIRNNHDADSMTPWQLAHLPFSPRDLICVFYPLISPPDSPPICLSVHESSSVLSTHWTVLPTAHSPDRRSHHLMIHQAAGRSLHQLVHQCALYSIPLIVNLSTHWSAHLLINLSSQRLLQMLQLHWVMYYADITPTWKKIK